MKSKWLKICILLTVILISCHEEQIDPVAKQLANEVTAIDNFIAANYEGKFVVSLNSGISMVIHLFGNGVPPHTGQRVQVAYTGSLFSNNSVFINTLLGDNLENINVDGLKTAVSYLANGATATVFIPSLYGYGTTGTTGVPANSTLVYEVNLISVTKTSAEQAQFDADTAAIHRYLIEDSVQNAVLHPTGIWYTIKTQGTGTNPNIYNQINLSIKGNVMSNNNVIVNGYFGGQSILTLVDGLKAGIPLMKEGGSAKFYIPSGLAYGKDSLTDIPRNSNLIYEVQLNSVFK